MANILNPNFNYTYDGIISTDMLYAPSVNAPDIKRLFRVITGVRSKIQLPTPQVLSKITKKENGCDVDVDGSVDITNVTLETCHMTGRVSQCATAFRETFLENELVGGMSDYELNQYLIGVARNVLGNGLQTDFARIFLFGDTQSDDENYNQCDGMFTRLTAGEIDYTVKKVSSISTLNSTVGTRAQDYLTKLYTDSSNLLKQLPASQKVFFVSGNFYENLMLNIETIQANGGFTYSLVDGEPILRFRGVDVLPTYFFDEWLADPDNPFNATMNTVAIYTSKDNHYIGLTRNGDDEALTIFYEKKDRKVYFDFKYNMGYQYVHGGLTSWSYGIVS